jgi:hypothetical protein
LNIPLIVLIKLIIIIILRKTFAKHIRRLPMTNCDRITIYPTASHCTVHILLITGVKRPAIYQRTKRTTYTEADSVRGRPGLAGATVPPPRLVLPYGGVSEKLSVTFSVSHTFITDRQTS